jgi:hypothetical protein
MSKRKFRKNKPHAQQKIHSFSTGLFFSHGLAQTAWPSYETGFCAPSFQARTAQFPQGDFQQGVPSVYQLLQPNEGGSRDRALLRGESRSLRSTSQAFERTGKNN